MKCKADIEIYTTRVNSQRVYIFLAGLDSQLDGVRGCVLATVPLPNAQIAFAMVCAEANRQNAMMGGTSTDGTAMAARRSSTWQDTKKGIRKCTHCNGDNHVVDTCFKLHGYPDWHPKGKRNSSLQPTSATGLVAQTGMTNTALSSSICTSTSDWIIDTSANDHMTCDSSRFSHLFPPHSTIAITNANGVSSSVTGVGNIPLGLNIHTKERIGSGKQRRGLYYLDGEESSQVYSGLAHVMIYVHLSPQHRTKLEPRALKCVFVGYGSTQKGYKCYHPETRKFYTSMDVIFDESKLHCSTIGFESADVPENVLQSTNSDDALCFDINSVTISTSANTRESLEDKTTVDNPQISSDQCENSPHLPDSTLSPLALVSFSPETLQRAMERPLDSISSSMAGTLHLRWDSEQTF
ncbi:hypothetical protein MRB53_006451 [Persea americana]|uniref:Uncharacterized protein n=1 Tax=Persea americana TaxID=3435 RepID=A0ACC2MGQ8_PERAE|nr:hypothetical protein MRB53_006451 [Persea americana]